MQKDYLNLHFYVKCVQHSCLISVLAMNLEYLGFLLGILDCQVKSGEHAFERYTVFRKAYSFVHRVPY